jgi:hypothetical protein
MITGTAVMLFPFFIVDKFTLVQEVFLNDISSR